MERDNNIIEILRKAYTEGYIAGIEGDEPKLGELSERQLLAVIKREYEMDYCNCKNPDLIKLMDEMLTACKGCRKEYLPPQKSDALCGKVKAEKCNECHGKGILVCEDGDTVNKCHVCNGTGITKPSEKAEPIPNVGLRTPDNHFSTHGLAGESRPKKSDSEFCRCEITKDEFGGCVPEDEKWLKCIACGKEINPKDRPKSESDVAEIINREPLPEEGKKWEWAKRLAKLISESEVEKDELLSLIAGVKVRVALWHADTPSGIAWKEQWLSNARKVLSEVER